MFDHRAYLVALEPPGLGDLIGIDRFDGAARDLQVFDADVPMCEHADRVVRVEGGSGARDIWRQQHLVGFTLPLTIAGGALGTG